MPQRDIVAGEALFKSTTSKIFLKSGLTFIL
jgi:hypothetical protein